MNTKRIFLGSFFLGLGLFFMYHAMTFVRHFEAEPGTLHPMAFPKVLLGIWLFFSLLYIFIPRAKFDAGDLIPILPLLGKALLSIVIFIVTLPYLGFIVSSSVFLALFFYLLGFRTPQHALPLALACGAGLWLVFEKCLGMPLPMCTLF